MSDKFRKVTHADALRMARIQSQLDALNARRELLQYQFGDIGRQAAELSKELKTILERNGHAGVKVGGVVSEDVDGVEAGTLMGEDGKPIALPEEAATQSIEKKTKTRAS